VADSRWLSITPDYLVLRPYYPVSYSQGGPTEPERDLFGHTIAGLSDAHQTIRWVAPNYLMLPKLAHLLLFCAKTSLLGPCFVVEGPAGKSSFGKSCLYVMPNPSLMKLRCYSVSEDEGSNRLKDGMTF
jgi:hypothetical protein